MDNISSRFSRNSEALTSEFLENFEEMFSDVCCDPFEPSLEEWNVPHIKCPKTTFDNYNMYAGDILLRFS